jgi:hypothetical protein|tara:strand:+ start:890 stop:1003 length:114 start_codon:yes stop_codon:yes gene_type:complete
MNRKLQPSEDKIDFGRIEKQIQSILTEASAKYEFHLF